MVGVLALVLGLVATQADRLTVYISAPVRDGFVDTTKDIQDSVNNLRDRLSGMKEFRVVPRRENADIVLTVVTRGVGSEAYGARVNYTEYYNNAELTSQPIFANTYWVAAVMEVGTYRKELMGAYTHEYAYSLGAWGDCAKQIANHVKSWAVVNADQVRQLRKQGL